MHRAALQSSSGASTLAELPAVRRRTGPATRGVLRKVETSVWVSLAPLRRFGAGSNVPVGARKTSFIFSKPCYRQLGMFYRYLSLPEWPA